MLRKFLCSFDDGNQLDMELAELLIKYKIPTVFYIPIKSDLYEGQIERLAGISDIPCETCEKTKGLFDIGAHTINHPADLKLLGDDELTREIAGSKEALEKIVKRPVTRFCYPRGRFDDRVKKAVKNAGFKEARTTKSGSINFSEDNLAVRPTVHVHPSKRYDCNGNESFEPEDGKDLMTWKEFAEFSLDKVIKEGGRFELWGHSYEIFEKYHQEEFLEDFLAYMDDELTKINYPREI